MMNKLRMMGFLLLLAASSHLVEAQRLKFNDLFPRLGSMSLDEQKVALKEYITFDNDHPNGNFRLALIYEKIYKSADPLTQYELILASAEQAKLRFLKAKLTVDDREVNRNNEYYFPIFKTFDAKGKPKVEFATVAARIQGGYDSAVLVLARVPPIYASFTSSVNHYDKAVRLFADINRQYLNLDDLYLYYNEDLDKKLGELKINFDSTRYYFDRYRELTKAFPITGQQQYQVKPIVTYRLNGLITRMNFLTPVVDLWDYAGWVDAIRHSVSTEIVSLRNKLTLNEDKLDESLNKINSPGGETIQPYKVDKQLVYNLNYYDKQSLVLSLLDYKAFKQSWLIKTKTLVADTASAEHTADNFSTLIYENKAADTLLSDVKIRLHPDKMKKHEAFITQYYGGMEGLLKYHAEEKKSIDAEFVRCNAELRGALMEICARDTIREKEKTIKFNNKWIVPMVTRSPAIELLDKGELVTQRNIKNRDGSVYLAGVYKPDKKANNLVVFVAHVNPDGKPGWLQNFNLKIDSLSVNPDADNFLGPMELTQEGCAFVVRSVHLTRHDAINTLVYLNEKGESKFRVRLKESLFARSINFIERSNSFVLALKGDAETETTSHAENIRMISVNALGDLIWNREIALTGTYIGLTNLLDGFILVGNYSVLRDIKGREIKTRPGEASPFIIRLTDRGEIAAVNQVSPSRSVCVLKVVKVSDNSINLLGFDDNFETAKGKTILSEGRLLHIMTNRFCQIVSSNL